MNINKLSFKARIFLGYLVIIAMMIVIVGAVLFNYARTEENLREVKNIYLPNALISSIMAHDVVNLQQFLTDVAATHDSEGLADARTTGENFKIHLNEYRQRLSNDATQQKEIESLETDFDKFNSDGKKWRSPLWIKALKQAISLKKILMPPLID